VSQVGLAGVIAEDAEARAVIPEQVVIYLPLFRELNDLKRLYAANRGGGFSYAAHTFRVAWGAILEGDLAATNFLASRAWAAARLGWFDEEVATVAGLTAGQLEEILRRSAESFELPEVGLRVDFQAPARPLSAENPWWVEALSRQPRAGATCPGKPRLILEPAENHADHCLIVALYAWFLAPHFQANPDECWLAGLCHHFHNALLPDAGFSGEEMLGEHLQAIIERLRGTVLRELPGNVCADVTKIFSEIRSDETPLARTFHAADTIDRVLQMQHYERVANFQTRHALQDLHLVHAGPTQKFQIAVLESCGLY